MKLKSYISLGIASAAAVLSGANAAEAAALQGRVGINPVNDNGDAAGVNLIGTGITGPNGNPLTVFDFVPPEDPNTLVTGGSTGAVIELNANNLDPTDPNTPNDFAPFITDTGTIQDLGLEEITDITAIEEFISIPGAFSFQLESLNFPEYTFDGGGTTVSVGVTGTFFNISDGTNDASDGVGTFSVDFAGLEPEQVRALFDEQGEISEAFNPTTWSSNFVATAEQPPNGVVPESSNLLGLLVIGLGGATMLVRKK